MIRPIFVKLKFANLVQLIESTEIPEIVKFKKRPTRSIGGKTGDLLVPIRFLAYPREQFTVSIFILKIIDKFFIDQPTEMRENIFSDSWQETYRTTMDNGPAKGQKATCSAIYHYPGLSSSSHTRSSHTFNARSKVPKIFISICS